MNNLTIPEILGIFIITMVLMILFVLGFVFLSDRVESLIPVTVGYLLYRSVFQFELKEK